MRPQVLNNIHKRITNTLIQLIRTQHIYIPRWQIQQLPSHCACCRVLSVGGLLAAGILDRCGVDTVVSGVDEPVCSVSSVMPAGELEVCGCNSLVSDEALVIRVVLLRWLVKLLRVVMTHCCLALFVVVAVCWWLDYEWLNLIGWTGSSAQTGPCGPCHHQCTQCVCVVFYWQLPVKEALYRIWCGANRLGDSGAIVVCIRR